MVVKIHVILTSSTDECMACCASLVHDGNEKRRLIHYIQSCWLLRHSKLLPFNKVYFACAECMSLIFSVVEIDKTEPFPPLQKFMMPAEDRYVMFWQCIYMYVVQSPAQIACLPLSYPFLLEPAPG